MPSKQMIQRVSILNSKQQAILKAWKIRSDNFGIHFKKVKKLQKNLTTLYQTSKIPAKNVLKILWKV